MKRFLLGLSSSALKTLLLLTAITAALTLVLSTPNTLKNALDQSKIYDGFVDNALSSIQKQSEPSENSDISIQPEFKKAVQDAFPPEVLKNTAEQIIDGTYHWLDGKTPVPDFHVDLSSAKAALATNLGDYAVKRFVSLPACTRQQLQQIGPEIDPLSIECRPAGLSTEQVRQEVTKQFANNDQFLSNPVITADTLSKDSAGKTPFDNLKEAPRAFSLAKKSGLVLGGLSVLLALGLILLRRDKRAGIKSVGYSLIGTGIFLALSTLLITLAFNQVNRPGGKLASIAANNTFKTSLISILQSLTNTLNQNLIKFGVGYIVIGGAMLLYLRFTRPKTNDSQSPSPLQDSLVTDKKNVS